jgi:hypothetical protein
MRFLPRKIAVVSLIVCAFLLAPVCTHAFFGTVPVVDWTAIARIGQQVGISQQTLNTLALYVERYNQINAGVHQGISLVRGQNLQGILGQAVGSQFPEFQQLQRDFRSVLVDPSTLRRDIEDSFGRATGDFPPTRKKRFDATDATATLGLLDASRMEAVAQQEELDANDIESRAASASPSGAVKLSAAANGALLRSQAYDHRLLGRLMRLQALAIARENSIEKEHEQVRQEQLTTVANMVGSMRLSYGIGEGAR